MLDIPRHRPHELKQDVRARKLALWQLRQLLGGSPSEGKLSRWLNGVDVMPERIEVALRWIIEEVKG